MALKYKIAILGPIPRDHITTHRGDEIERYGGVNHPSIALAKLLGTESTIIPVVHVRKKDEANIKEILRAFPNIDLNHIDSSHDQGDVIQLRFLDQNRRLEKQTGFMNPITTEDIKNLLDCDAFIMVPVTDFEISLDVLKFIRAYSKSLILYDAHGATNIMTTLGDRLLKFWFDRDNWLPYIDILKMNLEEAKCCWFKKKYTLTELENDYEIGIEQLRPFAKHCLNKGVKLICVTLDEQGCVIYYGENGKMQEKIVPAIKMEHIVDTTGCGDAFAAGLAFGVIYTHDYLKAAQYANALGALRTQGKTFAVFKTLPETEQLINKFYTKEKQ